MTLLLISFIAGVLTVLAPCILPLLPVIIGSSVGARSKATPYIVIGSLAVSILLFTYLLKASTALIEIPPSVWTYLSGGILFGFGLVLLFPKIWEKLPFLGKASTDANKLMGTGLQKKSIWGDVLIGAALGPVFSTCSPTYFVILATVLPASFFLGTVYLLVYLAGLVLVLLLIAKLGQKFTNKLQFAANSNGWFKKAIGALFIVVGIFIISGLDKKLETAVLDSGYFDVTRIEQGLLDRISAEEIISEDETTDTNTSAPQYLQNLFPSTDWSQSDPALSNALSGGPSKDGIPAIDNPKFIPLHESDYSDDVQAIVLQGSSETKIYPYNILTWHEIVNDTVDGRPVVITFCPLCGSAIVFDGTLPDGTISTFGVSGSLLESNMIMFDRETENLWQQSTGDSLAGSFFPSSLELEPMQLMTLGTVRATHPNALILSEETGRSRDYNRSPYAGYETNDRFSFEPSSIDTTIPPKTITAVFRTSDGASVAIPWLELRGEKYSTQVINNSSYTFSVTDNGELTITDQSDQSYPFYFEMWFSFAAQHGDEGILLNL